MKTVKRGAQKAPSKKDGRRALAVGTCSLRVPAAPLLALIKKWEQRSVNAAARQQACTQEGNHHQSDRYFDRRCAFDARIVELRRAMGLSDRRQPEENKADMPK